MQDEGICFAIDAIDDVKERKLARSLKLGTNKFKV